LGYKYKIKGEENLPSNIDDGLKREKIESEMVNEMVDERQRYLLW